MGKRSFNCLLCQFSIPNSTLLSLCWRARVLFLLPRFRVERRFLFWGIDVVALTLLTCLLCNRAKEKSEKLHPTTAMRYFTERLMMFTASLLILDAALAASHAEGGGQEEKQCK